MPMKPNTSQARLTVSDDYTTLHLSGEVVMESVPHLHNVVLQSLKEAKNKVTFELGGTTRIDSAGLAMLLSLFSHCKQNSVTPEIANAPETLVKLSKLSSADSLIGLQ